nr:unnamed protein product [Spirometra erinaceieuropaei]
MSAETSEIQCTTPELNEPNCKDVMEGLNVDHPLSLREHACDLCGKAFAHKGHLKQHVDGIHKKLRTHTCDMCGKAFARNADVKRHIDGVHKS